MKQYIINQNRKITYFFLIALSFFPVLPTGVESVLMIAAFLFSLSYFSIEGKKFWNRKKTLYSLLFSSLFLIYAFSLFYTQNIGNGIKYIIRLLPTILFPAIFLFNDKEIINNKQLEFIKSMYIMALILALVYLNFTLYDCLYKSEIQFWDFRQLIEKKIKVHGTYLSMWIGFGVILLFFKFKKEVFNRKNLLVYIAMLAIISYFIYWQYLIGSRMPFGATLLISSILMFKNRKQMFVFSMFFIVLGFVIILKTDRLGDRFQKLSQYNFSFPEGKYEDNYPNISTEQIRNGIYYCSFEKIKQQPILGYGVGDVDAELQSCYDNTFTNTDTYKVTRYNSHNQFLKIILSAGFVGLVLFLISILCLIKNAIEHKLVLYISFISFVFLNFSFENILSRHDGVLFFAFFSALFFFTNTQQNEKSIN
ncbi:O-antigen ligase family protein [Flavobacterium sp. IMCC34518]|uniref:O-antigen ligase family protein n=1 Tax=Flavobacterium sp. IMCC34518 TaxID=3003623 RepID=UPI00248224A6|nr:O-antigen ligase family protein [Flavobacterium sp. IMCC34518]